jgi:hypothetical protein
MSWGHDLSAQIAADFRDAQRKRRGPTDMSEDRPPVVLAQTIEDTVVARVRRIVTSRRAA